MHGEVGLFRPSAGAQDVGDGPLDACYRNSQDLSAILPANQPTGEVRADTRRDPQSALRPRQRHMDVIDDQIGEIKQLERTLVRDDTVGASEPQPTSDDVAVQRSRESPQPVDAVSDALECPTLGGVVRQRGARDSGRDGLMSGQVPPLALSDLVQPVDHVLVTRMNGFSVHIRDTIREQPASRHLTTNIASTSDTLPFQTAFGSPTIHRLRSAPRLRGSGYVGNRCCSRCV